MSKLLSLTAAGAAVLAVPMLALLAMFTATGAALACTSTPQLLVTPTAPVPAGTATRAAVSDLLQAAVVSAPQPVSTPSPSAADAPALRAAVTCLQAPRAGSVQVPPGAPAGLAAAITRSLSYVGLTSGYAHHCDRLACRAYNYANSGYPSATAHWQAMLATGHAHPGDRCPPAGTFMYWATSGPDGHVAFVARTDPGCDPARILLVSNDYGDRATGNTGGVYLVSLAQIQGGFVTADGYRGWSDPVCAGTLLPAGTHHPLPS